MNGKRRFNRNEIEKLILTECWEGLRDYDLRGADLGVLNFACADLDDMDLEGVDFRGAYLVGASFYFSNLTNADFRGAYITNTYFDKACMDGVIIDEMTSHFHTHCPEEGMFTAYKKAYIGCGLAPYIVELQIPAHALRSSATTNKCRCSEAKVMSITRLDGTNDGIDIVGSWRNPYFLYKIGETVRADGFNKNRWHECGSGIHFFMTREEAVDYKFL